jgi:hypothetical protein
MRTILLLLSFAFSNALFSQDAKPSTANIFQTLVTPDSLSGAKVTVILDSAIQNSILDRSKSTRSVKSGTGVGFRIQVFSSNVQRTAKTEAFNIEKEIRTAFPELGVYVSYTSPSWKVRVGDFKTTEEAQAFRPELIEAFPYLRNAIYTVKDKINF